MVKDLANKILGSVNPQQAFNNMLSKNSGAQNAMKICNEYGNGDPKTAFMNYAREKGKEGLAQQIMTRFGLS